MKVVRPESVRGISAERVARATFQGYLKNKREVIVPWTMHPVVKLYQLFPGLVEWGMEEECIRQSSAGQFIQQSKINNQKLPELPQHPFHLRQSMRISSPLRRRNPVSQHLLRFVHPVRRCQRLRRHEVSRRVIRMRRQQLAKLRQRFFHLARSSNTPSPARNAQTRRWDSVRGLHSTSLIDPYFVHSPDTNLQSHTPHVPVATPAGPEYNGPHPIQEIRCGLSIFRPDRENGGRSLAPSFAPATRRGMARPLFRSRSRKHRTQRSRTRRGLQSRIRFALLAPAPRPSLRCHTLFRRPRPRLLHRLMVRTRSRPSSYRTRNPGVRNRGTSLDFRPYRLPHSKDGRVLHGIVFTA